MARLGLRAEDGSVSQNCTFFRALTAAAVATNLAAAIVVAPTVNAQSVGPPFFPFPWFMSQPQFRQPLLRQVAPPRYQRLAVRPQGPYAIEGVGLGDVLDDKTVYPSLNCSPSEVFRDATWCQRSRSEMNGGGSFTDTIAFLRSNDGRAYYLARIIEPASFRPGDAEKEIERLSRVYHQTATVIHSPERTGLPIGVIATWGDVTYSSLDEADVRLLADGKKTKAGFIVDFLGDFKRSAQEGLPIYLLSGGAGLLWNASFDESGKGMLRISAIDASKLTLVNEPQGASASQPPPQMAPAAEPQPQSQVPTEAAGASNDEAQSSRPSASSGSSTPGTWCSLLTDATQRQACYDKATGGLSAPPSTSQPETPTGKVTPAQRERGCAVCVPDQPSAAQSEPANGGEPGSMPSAEQAVISVVQTARQAYNSGSNDLQKGAARVQRGKGICEAIPDRRAIHWTGKVSELSSNGEGKGVLAIEIADGIQVKTWNNAFSDAFDDTLIGESSPVFKRVQTLTVGERVQFSGAFPGDDNDCIKEPSLTLEGSISEPDFIFKFTEITPIEAPI